VVGVVVVMVIGVVSTLVPEGPRRRCETQSLNAWSAVPAGFRRRPGSGAVLDRHGLRRGQRRLLCSFAWPQTAATGRLLLSPWRVRTPQSVVDPGAVGEGSRCSSYRLH
jgi:hypothetical protein